jgi:hypothetical protein
MQDWGVLKKREIMGKSQETQQLAVGMSRKCGFGSYRPMEKARKETKQLAVGMSGKCGFGSYRPHLWLFP